jgi:hypothetical protein
MRCTRVEPCTATPCDASQRVAGAGSSADSGTRGSSRSAAPGPLNSASRSTLRKTTALAWCAGVFIAATHSGSISVVRARSGKARTSSATVCCGAARKPASRQRSAARRSASRSPTGQSRSAHTARTKAGTAGPGGKASPPPCGSVRASGRRSSSACGSAPTVRIKASVSR